MAEKTLTHRQRLENCLSGGPLDRAPVALWRHFPVDDQTPDGLASAVLHFQKNYDFDLVKVTPASSFCLKDWGVQDKWVGNSEGTRDYTNIVIYDSQDWYTLPRLDTRQGVFGNQITSLQLIHKEIRETTPFLQTIFSPLAQAKHLCGPERLLDHIRQSPEELHAGLQIITDTTIQFIQDCLQTGIAGIFYAVQHAQQSLLNEEEYLEFGKPYDLQILESASSLWLNMLHLHGSEVYFDLLADYPVQVINWHDRETSYSLQQGLNHTHAVVCGGLRQWQTLALGNPEDIRKEGLDALQQTGGKRLILGTGCVMPIISPHGNIFTVRQVVEQ